MRTKIKIWAISVIVISVLLPLSMSIDIAIEKYLAKRVFEEVKNHDKVYVYDTYFGALNAVMYVDEPKDTIALIDYYYRVANKDTTAVINFELKFMPITLYNPIYIYAYPKRGSNVIQVIDFNTRCWGYIKGYIYKHTTHLNAPPDSLIKRRELSIAKINSDKNVQITNRIYKKINPYGWYCSDK